MTDIYITAVRLEGGSELRHITRLRWRDPGNGETGEESVQQILDWLKGGSDRHAWVLTRRQEYVWHDQAGRSLVEVIGTHAGLGTLNDHGGWTDDLLTVSRF